MRFAAAVLAARIFLFPRSRSFRPAAQKIYLRQEVQS